MQSENGSDTINFETLTSQMIVFFKQKSQRMSQQPSSEEADRAVENHPRFETNENVKENPRKTGRTRKNHLNWSQDQQLEYFYAAIKFSIDYPYFTTSWKQRKPNRFYKYVAAHMEHRFGKDKARTALQCKPKDQNFKKLYFDEAEQPKDLIELSYQMLNGFIKETSGQAVMCQQKVEQVNRYEAILNQYQSAVNDTKKIKEYELQLRRLWDYSKKMTPMIKQIHGSL